MSIELLKTKIAIIPISDPEKIGHIYIPDSAQQKVDQGVVKYRGPDVKQVRVGDHVLFSGYSGDMVALADEGTYLLMEEKDVMAILTGEEAMTLIPLEETKRLVIAAVGDERSLLPSPEGQDAMSSIEERILARLDALVFSEGFKF